MVLPFAVGKGCGWSLFQRGNKGFCSGHVKWVWMLVIGVWKRARLGRSYTPGSCQDIDGTKATGLGEMTRE